MINIYDILEQYRDKKRALQPALNEIKALEREIKEQVSERGEGVGVDGAEATIRSGYTRTTCDGKALAGYAVAHPEIKAFATEKEVGPSVVIKVSL